MPRSAAAAVSRADVIAAATSGKFLLVAVADLHESPHNPRRVVEDGAFLDLVESVAAHGVIEPLVVRDVADQAGFELVAGHRRLRAARVAGLLEVPVMVRALDDRAVLELQLAENVHRASMTPLEEARALQRLGELDGIYRDPRVLAGKIGRSETYVRERLRLLRLVDSAQQALDAGAITATHAERIARLPPDEQVPALLRCFSALFLTDHDEEETQAIWEQQIARANDEDLPTVQGRADALLRAGRWDLLAPAIVSLRELDNWIDAHATIDVTAPEVQQALRPALEEIFPDGDRADGRPEDAAEEDAEADPAATDAAYAAATEELPRLSSDWNLTAKEAAALRVLPLTRWKQFAEGEQDCGHGQTGIIVHGELEDGSRRTKPELVTFCADRTCTRHWPQEPRQKTKSGAAAPRVDWKAEAEKREREQAAWNEEFQQLKPLLVRHTTGIKLTPKILVQAVPNIGYSVAHHFGLQITDKTIGQALALYGLSRMNAQELARSAKAIGFDVKAARKEIARAAKKAKPAPAARKGGRK